MLCNAINLSPSLDQNGSLVRLVPNYLHLIPPRDLAHQRLSVQACVLPLAMI